LSGKGHPGDAGMALAAVCGKWRNDAYCGLHATLDGAAFSFSNIT